MKLGTEWRATFPKSSQSSDFGDCGATFKARLSKITEEEVLSDVPSISPTVGSTRLRGLWRLNDCSTGWRKLV